MAVYQYKTLEAFCTNLRNMASVFVGHSQLVLSDDEFIRAFIAPEHVPKLQEVAYLVGNISTSSYNGFSTIAPARKAQVRAYVSYLKQPILTPAYCGDGPRPDAPPELMAKIRAWADQRYEFGVAMGDATDAVRYLNDCCKNVAAMTALFPCLPAIMAFGSQDGDTANKRAKKAAVVGRAPEIPNLPRAVKERLREVSAVVNAITLMVDAPIPEPKSNEVRIIGYVGYGADEPFARTNIFYPTGPNTAAPVATYL